MIRARTKRRLTIWAALLPLIGTLPLSLAGCCGGGLGNLMPGNKDAEVRERAQKDSFPTAAEAMHAPAANSGNP